MTKGLKVWLYLVLVLNAISVVTSIIAALVSPASWILVLTSVLIVAGAALLLFKTQKLGFYLICAAAVVNLIFNVVSGISIFVSIIPAIIMPLIIYLLMKNTWSEFK